MKRTIARILGVLAAAALFAGLVHLVLVAGNVSEPAAVTVYGPTARRLWATTGAGLGLVGAVVGGWAFARPGRFRVTVALVAGAVAAVNGTLVVALADGGPGTGNGVVGGAGALVLGLIALALGGVALARGCRPIERRA